MTSVVALTGAVLQVGSWQRSDHRFRLACEIVRGGRIGRLRKVTVVLGKNKQGGPFNTQAPPPHLNWDVWQGQTPTVSYCPERCHYTFRWWYEYSGGQVTDWGAHHMDIAQWGMGVDRGGPLQIDGRAEFPSGPNGYDVATSYQATMRYPEDVTLELLDSGRNGVMFEGERGRVFVNRGVVSGKSVEQLKENPLPREKFNIYGDDNLLRPARVGKLDAIVNHMGNFFDCIKTRRTPISDILSQHRSVSACHLANISMRLGRPLRWDAQKELFIGDDEANTWLSRSQRPPYEVQA